MKTITKHAVSLLFTLALLLSAISFVGLSDFGITSSAETKTYKTGDVISYGSYPQSRVTDTNLIAALDAQPKNWVSYQYYSGTGTWDDGKMKAGDWMRYADFNYNGTKYRAVLFDSFRPSYTCYSLSDPHTVQNQKAYLKGTIYYFTYDALRWKVLNPKTGLVMSVMILDAQPYQNVVYRSTDNQYYQGIGSTSYANNYASSSIRSWLTGNFYNTAFSPTEQSYLAPTWLDNSACPSTDSRYNSVSTQDSVFLLSYKEITNSAYGFNSVGQKNDPYGRGSRGTDYAECQGLLVSQNFDQGNSYWLRSPGQRTNLAGEVNYSGFASGYNDYVVCTRVGVRPAFCFKDGRILDESLPGELSVYNSNVYFTTAGSDTVYRPDSDEKCSLSALVTFSNPAQTLTSEDVTWISSDPSIFSVSGGAVSKTGDAEWTLPAIISAKKPGTVTVTVKTKDDLEASVTVHVVDYDISIAAEHYVAYVGDTTLYNDEGAEILDLLAYIKGETDVLLPGSVWWESSDPAVLEVRNTTVTKDMQPNRWIANCGFKALKPGKVTLTAYVSGVAKDTVEIEVKNELEFSVTHDQTLYFADNCFLGEGHGLSDSVNFYLLFDNTGKKKEQNADPDAKPVKPITVTATADGSVFSFERDKTVTAFKTTYDAIPSGVAIDDLLTLFVKSGANLPAKEQTYTLKIKLESESFEEPIEENYAFTLKPMEQKNADDHILFFDTDKEYRISKLNGYGDMSELKKSFKYKFESFLDVEFKNYHDVVLADLIQTMLAPAGNETEENSNGFLGELISEVNMLKSWKSTYKTVLGKLKSAADYKYEDVTESDLDKLLKKSKYQTEPDKVTDKFRDEMVLFFGNESKDNINKLFATVDKSKQIVGLIKTGKSILDECNTFVDRMALYNTYTQADEKLKDVMRTLGETLPENSDMREAVFDYVNAASSTGGFMSEFYESLKTLQFKVSAKVFKYMVGKNYWKYANCQLFNWLKGNPASKAAKFLTSAKFTQAFGGVLTGYSLGSLASNLLCNSSDEKRETAKIIAMADYSDYIVQALLHYETQVRTNKNDDAVGHYEYAFALHKACQYYLMEHTVEALRIERDCPLLKFLKKHFDYDKGYDAMIVNVMAEQFRLKQMVCHSDEYDALKGSRTTESKVIKIKCPVNVSIFNADGEEIVRITNNKTAFASASAEVLITPADHKFILLPADGSYRVKLSAFDAGTMEYGVYEIPANETIVREVTFSSIPLVKNRAFEGVVPAGRDQTAPTYALRYDNILNNKHTDLTYYMDGSGKIEKTEIVIRPGDVDRNGEITAADARLALRAAVGLENYGEVTAEFIAADASGDGAITAEDARLILRAAVGLEDPAKWPSAPPQKQEPVTEKTEPTTKKTEPTTKKQEPTTAPAAAEKGVYLSQNQSDAYLTVETAPLGNGKTELKIYANNAKDLTAADFTLLLQDGSALAWDPDAQGIDGIFKEIPEAFASCGKDLFNDNSFLFSIIWKGTAGKDKVLLASCVLDVKTAAADTGIVLKPADAAGGRFRISLQTGGAGTCLGAYNET